MTGEPGPFITIRPGSPFADAVVSVRVNAGEHGGRFLVSAAWDETMPVGGSFAA